MKLIKEKCMHRMQYRLIINLLRNRKHEAYLSNYDFIAQEKLLKAITRLSLNQNSIKDPSTNYQDQMISLNLEGVNLSNQFGILVSSLKKNS